ncbi:MAG TPA: TrkA C-terminal domain-containing protein [Bacteroidales bacterium]|nr:TrkA C-terminal domain-containing protein [Bacteroidales bacterium]
MLILEIFRVIIGLLIVGFLVNAVFTTVVALLILVPFILVVLFIFSNHIKKFYQRLEDRFLNNLNTQKSHQDKDDASINTQKQISQYLDQTPWNIHIIELEVGPHATFIGQTLESLSWREKFGINVAFIKRGEEMIYAPSRISRLFPFDKIGIIATDEQMLAFSAVFNEVDKINCVKHKIEDVGICAVQINEYNKLKGLSIKDSRIREYTNGMVIVIERNKQRLLNPVSATVFEWGDIVWIAGERSKIQKLNQR